MLSGHCRFLHSCKTSLGDHPHIHRPNHSARSKWYRPLLFQRGVTAITRSPLLANSAVHNFDSVLFGSHDNFSALSVLPSQQQGLPSSGHLLLSLGICLLKPVSQLTPITEDRFQHEICLHPIPDKVVYVGQGLGDGFHLGFNYYSTSFKWTGGGGYGFGTPKTSCHWKFRQAGWRASSLSLPSLSSMRAISMSYSNTTNLGNVILGLSSPTGHSVTDGIAGKDYSLLL